MLSPTLLLSLVVPAFAAVAHESLPTVPRGWTESSTKVSDNDPIQLQVALPYQNLDSLESTLLSVSTPGNAKYGKYLDVDAVEQMFKSSDESVDKVTSWLQGAGASSISKEGGVVSFLTTVGKANKMLGTEFKVYTDGNTERLRTTSYSVPQELTKHIDFVSPTIYFSSMKAHVVIPRSQRSAAISEAITKRQFQTSCEILVHYPIGNNKTKDFNLIGPQCLKELYNIGDYKPDPKSGSSIAFGSFLNESASYSDLAQYEKIYNIPFLNFTVLALINGGVDNQDPTTELDGEANLDVQNIIGLVDGLPVGEYITGGSPPFIPDLLSPTAADNQNEPYLEYYTYLLGQPNSKLPYVISNSYGDHENTVPQAYATRVCNMIGMMGLRGRTILESSGDEGVGAVCRNNVAPYQAQFTPQFPGTCPYVTAVGGTQFFNPEYAWNASSGGFSLRFKQPAYQTLAVQTYLNNFISPATKEYYSSNNYTDFTGRGFPDISAHSLYPDYLTVIDGQPTPNGGTSAATPVVAAIFALLNDARFRIGKPALGFINPALYTIGLGGINDITSGGSVGCGGVDLQNGQVIPGAGIIPYASWNATTGWDPVTGLGTPNFGNLKDIFLAL